MIETVVNSITAPVFVNIYSLIILSMFLFTSPQRSRALRSRQFNLFRCIVITNIFLLVTDTVNWLVVGNPDPQMRTIQITVSMVYYALDPLPAYFFIRFTDEALNVPAEKQGRWKRWYLVPFVLNLLITLATPFTGWFFRIDAMNEYHRGSLLFLSFILSFVLMFVAAGKTLYRYVQAHKWSTEIAKNITEYGWLLRFTIIPIIGGAIQIFFNNVTYVWNITVIALLFLYISNQNAEITTDALTGVYNRRQAYGYFERFVREREKDKENATVALVVLDINNFKLINDQYGHIIGMKRSSRLRAAWKRSSTGTILSAASAATSLW